MCEAAQTRREAIVSVTCGASDRLVDAREPESCRYMLSVQSVPRAPRLWQPRRRRARKACEQANGAKLEASFDEEVRHEIVREANEASARAKLHEPRPTAG